MCEIVLLIILSRKIAEMAKNKGLAGWPFVLLLIFCWVVGEIGGIIAAVIVIQEGGGGPPDPPFILVIPGLVCAAIGAGIAFGICAIIPGKPKEDPYDRYGGDDFDRPRRRRRPRDDDDDFDDRPRSSRRPVDDDDDRRRDDDRFRDRRDD